MAPMALIGRRMGHTAAVLGATIITPSAIAAIPWMQTAHLAASDAAAGDWFGYSVAIHGDTAIVGAWWDDGPAGLNQGTATVFVRRGGRWFEQARLLAADAAPSDWFGTSVDVSGDTAIVGAPLADGQAGIDQGAAYVFGRSGSVWTQQVKLVPSMAMPYAFYGQSVALDRDTAVVGAQGEDAQADLDQGAAYVFVRTGNSWMQQARLVALDTQPGDFFGYSAALNGQTAIIGAIWDDSPLAIDQGSAYVFVRDGDDWMQQAKLNAPDAVAGDIFGNSVAVHADTAVVGASSHDGPAGANQGAAYVFVRSGTVWTLQATLTASNAAPFDLFGADVDVFEGTAVVGAYHGDGDAGPDQGFAYVFCRAGSTWTEQTLLTGSELSAGDFFGNSVAIDVDTLIIAAVLDDGPPGNDHGSIYVFERVVAPADLNGDGVVDGLDLGVLLSFWSIPPGAPACAGASPCPADLNSDGLVDGLDVGVLLSQWTG